MVMLVSRLLRQASWYICKHDRLAVDWDFSALGCTVYRPMDRRWYFEASCFGCHGSVAIYQIKSRVLIGLYEKIKTRPR